MGLNVATPYDHAAVHRFGLGQRLRMEDGGSRFSRAGGTCVVVRLLPANGGDLQYRVKSEDEHFERVVSEVHLSALLPETL